MARDLLGQIADARAQMMMRGYDPLMLEIGRITALEFARQSKIADIEDWAKAAYNLKIIIRTDMEGWAIRPATD